MTSTGKKPTLNDPVMGPGGKNVRLISSADVTSRILSRSSKFCKLWGYNLLVQGEPVDILQLGAHERVCGLVVMMWLWESFLICTRATGRREHGKYVFRDSHTSCSLLRVDR